MSLSPQDIQRDFKERFRGYDPDEVDEHLSRLADRVVSLQDERDRALERMREIERTGGGNAGGGNGTLDSERLLKRTLIAAEQTADRVVSEAESEAERVVSDARRRADELLASARSAAWPILASSWPSSTVEKRTALAMVWRWMKPSPMRSAERRVTSMY